jgi:hypothetical protein
MNLERRSRPAVIALGGLILLFAGALAFPPGESMPTARGADRPAAANAPQTQPQTQPAAQLAPKPKLTILLLIDVSGSMDEDNKLAQAKSSAIQAIWNAAPQTVVTGSQVISTLGPSVVTSAPIPGIPPSIQQKFDKYLKALSDLQKALGPDIRAWVTKAEAKELGAILQKCEALMQGLAFEQKSELMKRLSPLVEKMHYSLAGYVNDSLGGGLKYVLPGKTPSNTEFGGLFTLKKSDHDAIYLGAKSEEAKRLHQELSKTVFGEGFSKTTETCLESSRYTLEKVEGGFRQAFEKFTGPTSNLDWMRTPSGSKWVQEYVDKAGTVVDLDNLSNAENVQGAMRKLNSYTDDELKALGVTMDRRGLADLGYNLGLMSDFERQLALNQQRHALEKGQAVLDKADDAMLKAKYGPRYLEVMQQSGVAVPPDAQKYVDDVVAIGKKAKSGQALTAAEESLVGKFDDFAKQARQASVQNQLAQYQKVSAMAAQAGDEAARAGLAAKAQEILDDTQAAIHNYQQLYGENFAKGLTDDIDRANKGLGDSVAQRLQTQPWVAGEAGIAECARTQLAAEGKLPAGTTPAPAKAVITDSQSLWQQVKQNPGHAFAKFAQYGGYAWMAYDVLALIHEGRDTEALKTAAIYGGIEGGTQVAEYTLATKFGAGAGGWLALSALGGFMVGNTAANWMQNSQVNEMTTQMMSGYANDGTKFYQGDGMLQALGGSGRSDDEIMAQIKPGTFGNQTIGFDPNGNVTITKKVTKLRPMGHGEYFEVEVDETTTVAKSQILAHQRLQEMFNVMRGKYNEAVERGDFADDERRSLDELPYEDPHFTTHPEGRFMIPNAGGLSLREYEFYKKTFDEAWGQWSLDKNPQWQDSSYWGNSMENAYKAKWAMFRQMIAAVGEGKKRDRDFAEKLKTLSPEKLAALKQMIESGVPFFLDGKKLTAEEIQRRIDAREKEIQDALEKAKNTSSVSLPDDLKKLLEEIADDTVVPDLAAGNVEFGIMPYSGSCASRFSLFGFTFDAMAAKAAIEGLSAGGGTPMSTAIAQAGHAIRRHGRGQAGTIILLCDGQNDCAEDPVKATASVTKRSLAGQPGAPSASSRAPRPRFSFFPALHAEPLPARSVTIPTQAGAPAFIPIDMNEPLPPGRDTIPITLSTVGFQVTADQQRALDEIAQAGGGISGSAQNMTQLTRAFSSAIQQASLVTFSGGGGGAALIPSRGGTNWTLIALAGVLVASTLLVFAIVVVRRRGAGAAVGRVSIVLDVFTGDGGRKSVAVRGRETTIGRGEDNGLVLRDPQVSGRHAVLFATHEGIWIRDLGSANGTFVNGHRIGEQMIYKGDQITIGATTLVVH